MLAPPFQVHNSGSTAADVTLLFTWAVSLCLFVLHYTGDETCGGRLTFISDRFVEFGWREIGNDRKPREFQNDVMDIITLFSPAAAASSVYQPGRNH